MQKCTLSRIKSYEEKHYKKPKRPINIKVISSNNSVEDLTDNYLKNYTNTNNFQIPYKIYDTKDNILKSKSEINTTTSYIFQANYKYNNYNNIKNNNNKILKKRTNNFSENNTFLSTNPKNILIPRKKTNIINNHFKNQKNYLVSTGNTTGDIDISDNEDINEFNSDEKESIMNGHIPSLTNIFIFPKYFGNAKSNKEIKKKENDFIKHKKTDENQKSAIEIKEKEHNYSTTNSKNKYNFFNKLNFDQPNKNILDKIINNNKDNIIKKEINRIHKINKNENKQISSYNNLNKTNNIIKKLTHKNNIANNKCSSSITIKKINNQKMNLKKESLNFIQKNITTASTSTSISVQQNKLNKIFQRKESQNKKGKNILNKNVPNIFIKNSILNTNSIKRPSTTYNEKNSNSNINAKKDSGSLIFNHFANEKMKNIIKTNAKKDINISVKSKNNNNKINSINNNKKNQNNN